MRIDRIELLVGLVGDPGNVAVIGQDQVLAPQENPWRVIPYLFLDLAVELVSLDLVEFLASFLEKLFNFRVAIEGPVQTLWRLRSDERRVGNEGVRTCRSRW